jgi:hypothetical protein
MIGAIVGVIAAVGIFCLLFWLGVRPLHRRPLLYKRFELTLAEIGAFIARELEVARRSVRVCDSTLNPICWEQVAEQLDTLLDQRGETEVRFIAFKEADRFSEMSDNPICSLARQRSFEVRIVRRKPVEQFILVDDDSVLIIIRALTNRVALPREGDELSTNVSSMRKDAIRADVLREMILWRNNVSLASKYNNEFERAWAQLPARDEPPEAVAKPQLDRQLRAMEALSTAGWQSDLPDAPDLQGVTA